MLLGVCASEFEACLVYSEVLQLHKIHFAVGPAAELSEAGTAFSKEIRDMKRHLREVGTEDDLHAKGDAG